MSSKSGDRGQFWERSQKVFLEALEIAPCDRADFLARQCAGDAVLLEEVHSLLAHDILEHDRGEAELENVFQYAAAELIRDGSRNDGE